MHSPFGGQIQRQPELGIPLRQRVVSNAYLLLFFLDWYSRVSLNDEVWEVIFHFFDRDNLERNISLSDITFWNLVALVQLQGYSCRDYMYYVRDPGVGVSGMEELTDDDKVEGMLDELGGKGENVVNIIVMGSDAPTPADLNRGAVYEEQVPLSEIGVPLVYAIDTSGVLFPSQVKAQPQPVEVMHTHDSIEPEFVVDNDE
ncbi:RNA-dependent RNA polymerase 1 [Hordeum vulgare]|nr:RNA-dependent RNA polymerase 1 [Hordeum vulgare]